MINIIMIIIVILNRFSIGSHIIIHLLLDITEPFRIARGKPDAFDSFKYHSLIVAPACSAAGNHRKRIGPQVHGSIGQLLGIGGLLLLRSGIN